MKVKALVAVILALVLVLAFAGSVLADQGGIPNGGSSGWGMDHKAESDGFGNDIHQYQEDAAGDGLPLGQYIKNELK